jgi:hypothetical protein
MPRVDRTFLALQLSLGLLWIGLLPRITDAPLQADHAAQVSWMLLWAAWCPGLPLAIWQARPGRRWRSLVASDLLFNGGLIVISCTAYLPLFFTQIPWFWLNALPPRGVLTAVGLMLIRRHGDRKGRAL